MPQMCPACSRDNADQSTQCQYCWEPLRALLGAHTLLQQRYEVVSVLGCGGMGAVYQARDHRLGDNCVAVKENFNVSPESRAQFQREANVLAKLDHPNLPKVIDHFIEPTGRQYLVMEYVDGEDLETMVEQRGALPVALVLNYADTLLDALSYLHERPQPILHRDIKPSNIKLTAEGKIKLVDFGLVKISDTVNSATSTSLRGLATPHYAPPEQYIGLQHTDRRSDLYALGATLYHLLTSSPPSMAALRSADPNGFIKPMRLNPAIPPSVQNVILKAMEQQMDKRFQSAREMQQALKGRQRLATRVWVIGGIITVILLAIILVLWGQQTGQGPFGGLLAVPTATATAPVTSTPASTVTPTVTLTLTVRPTTRPATVTPILLPTNTATFAPQPGPSPRPTQIVVTSIPTPVCPAGQFWNPVMNRCQSTNGSPLATPSR